MEALLKFMVIAGGTSITFLFGAWHVTLTILLVFMVADFVTGILKGAYLGKLRSSVGYKGILKKGGIIIVVIVGNMLDLLVGNGMPVFRTMVVFFFIGNEGISILENVGQMGIKVPKGIKNKLQQLRDNADTDEEDKNM